MKSAKSISVLMTALFVALAIPATAQILYTQVNASIPIGGSLNLDVNGDGVTDFVLQSKLLQGYCNGGDEYVWNLSVSPTGNNGVAIDTKNISPDNAAAMQLNEAVNSALRYDNNTAVMAGLYWGGCGIGTLGEWLNLPDRYLGFQFRDSNNLIHYGWAKISTAAYIDSHNHPHATAIVSGYAYQAIPGQAILAGQTSD